MNTDRSYPCGRRRPMPMTRRAMLRQCSSGFGAVALAALMRDLACATPAVEATDRVGGATPHGPHHTPRAKQVIFLYMDGGPSQVDTFDPKPMLTKYDGRDPGTLFHVEPTQFNNNGKVLGSPWRFGRYGESGLTISDLFPHVATCADELAVVRSMVSDFPEHTSANYFLHTGSGLQGRPSMGAWVNYGLGSAAKNLPGFVVINGGLIPPGGLDCFGSGFLPASFQGSVFKPSGGGVANIERTEPTAARQRRKLDLARRLDALAVERDGASDGIESAIRSAELAFEMQMAVPRVMSIDNEPSHIRSMYGLDSRYGPTRIYGTQCLIARRMIEAGVRFIELTCPVVGGDRWDQHSNLKEGHENNARAVDQPIAALLKDLRARGLLDETLVVWAGEFGRTPFAQGKNGRDHNQYGFSIWMAGGGTRAGAVYGETDEWGYKVVDGRAEVHDLHATMLYLLGVDHKRSTFRFGGRDMRLTDVKGRVIGELVG